MDFAFMVVLVFLVILVFIIAATGLRIVRPWEKGLIERLGRYQRTAGSGLTLIIPFLDRLLKVDMREQVVDVPPQQVITKDNVCCRSGCGRLLRGHRPDQGFIQCGQLLSGGHQAGPDQPP